MTSKNIISLEKLNYEQKFSIIRGLTRFQIKFSDSKTPRTVTLSSGNRAQFKRDDDAEILEEWLIRRGFIIVAAEDDGE